VYADAEIIYGEELSHRGGRFSKTIFFSMAEVVPILGRHSELATSSVTNSIMTIGAMNHAVRIAL
jgi:hypothetical protein